MDKRLIGVIISGVWSVVVLLMLTVFENAFGDSGSQAIATVLLVGGPIVALVSFFLVDFGACLKMLWRIMISGGRFPIIPVNWILFMFSFSLGIAIGIWFPIVVTLLTYLKGQSTETDSV